MWILTNLWTSKTSNYFWDAPIFKVLLFLRHSYLWGAPFYEAIQVRMDILRHSLGCETSDCDGHLVVKCRLHSFIHQFSLVVVGCPDPILPKGAWYKRNLDKVAVHCNRSSETWFLYCSGNRWIGPTRNCSQGKRLGDSGTTLFGTTSNQNFPATRICNFGYIYEGVH